MNRRPTRPAALAALAALALVACRTPNAGTASPAPSSTTAAAPAAQPASDRTQVPQPGPPPELKVPSQVHFQLKNGLKVRLVEHHRLPIVALYLVVDAGAVHDPPDRPGLASFTAAMLAEGTKRRSATKISDDLGFIGATLSASAGFDSASLAGAALSQHLDALLDIFADVLVSPTFPAGDFARVQDQRIVALKQQLDEPRIVAAKALVELAWMNHPYGHWALGTEKSLRAFTRADLAAYHAARWRPGAAELVVVGDVTQRELADKLESALGAWNGPKPAPLKAGPPKPPPARTVVIEKRGASPQTFVLMGMPGIPRSSPDYVATMVAMEVLGGGSSSRLFKNLREKEGYTYGIYAREEARKLAGGSVIAGSVKTEVTGPAMHALLAEIAAMRDHPVTQEELDVARNALLLSLPGEFANVAGIASKVAEEVIYGLPDDYWDSYAKQIAKVTADDVQRAARKVLDTGHLNTVMVGDPRAVDPQIKGLPLGTVSVRKSMAE